MWSDLRIVLAGLSVLLQVQSISAEPLAWYKNAAPLRARDAEEALKILDKRLLYCPETGGSCYSDETCCGYLCCLSGNYCVADLYCSPIDPTGTATTDLPTATAATATGVTKTANPTSTSGSSSSSDSDTASGSSTNPSGKKEKKCSSFSCWSTGAKVGVVVGPIVGVLAIAGIITLVVCLTCCKSKRKKNKTAKMNNAGPYGGAVDVGAGAVDQPTMAQDQKPVPVLQTVQQIPQQQEFAYGGTVSSHAPAPAYTPPPQQQQQQQQQMQDQYVVSPVQSPMHTGNGVYAQNVAPVHDGGPMYNEQTGGYVAAEKRNVFEAPDGTRN